MYIAAPNTTFQCSNRLFIPSVDEENDVLRYLARLELEDADNMDIFTAEKSRNEYIEVLNNVSLSSRRIRQIISDLFNYSKHLAKDCLFE